MAKAGNFTYFAIEVPDTLHENDALFSRDEHYLLLNKKVQIRVHLFWNVPINKKPFSSAKNCGMM